MEGYKEFVDKTINSFEEESFQLIKRSLVGNYLEFSFIKDENITKELLSEKVCDYFEKVELGTGKSFNEQIKEYVEKLESLVENYIAETPRKKKKDSLPAVKPRARKYFDEVTSIRDPQSISLRKLIDYSRIMLCLYTAIIDNGHKVIDDFNYSADCLEQGKVIGSMKREKSKKRVMTKAMFDTEELYSMDTCTFVFTIIMLQTIADERR